jgi:hypothetical protein
MGRQPHHPPVGERFGPDPSPPENPTPAEAMAHRLKTREGRDLYALRKGTVQSLGGSGRHRQLLRWFAPRIEQMAKSGSERAIVDRATNLKNGISATP